MRKEKMNNKGFSLVELIIVIAIMAILIVVLAPQYLKYVEKSRNSTDLQNATEMVTAIQIYAADPEAAKPFVKAATFSIKISATGGAITADTAAGSVADALTEAGITIADIKCSSKTKWTDYIISGKVEDSGAITFTYSATNAGEGTAFSDAMKGSATTTTNP